MQVVNRGNNKIDKKGWIKGIILIVAWILIFSLAKDLWQLKKGYLRINETKTRLLEEENKNIMLKDKLEMVMTDQYKERIIREQLNMQKVGEVVAVLPKGEYMLTKEDENIEDTAENWEKWWSLLK